MPVIELVKVGDVVKAEDALVTLELDNMTMDVPAFVRHRRVAQRQGREAGGTPSADAVDEPAGRGDPSAASAIRRRRSRHPRLLRRVRVERGSRGCRQRECGAAEDGRAGSESEEAGQAAAAGLAGSAWCADQDGHDDGEQHGRAHGVKGSGDKGRILKEDVEAFAASAAAPAPKTAPSPASASSGLDVLPWPKVDFAKFGPIESKPLSRIKKISGANLHRNWVMIPHVTNHEDADITDLEAFRVRLNEENAKSGVRVSMLAFMIKAACATLAKFPEFNASLDGDNLVLKKYFHIGFAADTPQGLVVPVIRDADKKGVVQIAQEMGELAKLARDGKLKPDQMQGGSFTISSLGGIGGIYFTPIINAPEVAIMGVCRSFWKQVSSDGKTATWRYVLPLSLSWDHRARPPRASMPTCRAARRHAARARLA